MSDIRYILECIICVSTILILRITGSDANRKEAW